MKVKRNLKYELLNQHLFIIKIFSSICYGCNMIDTHKEESKHYWFPIKEEQKLIYHKKELNRICSNILDRNYEKKFEFHKKKIEIEKIKKDIDTLNLEVCNKFQKKNPSLL